MIAKFAKSFLQTRLVPSFIQSPLFIKKKFWLFFQQLISDSHNKMSRYLKQKNNLNPKLKYGLMVFIITTCSIWSVKREKGQQRSAEQLIESLKKSETDSIEIIRYIKQKTSKKPTQDKQTTQPYQQEYRVHYKINGQKYFAVLSNPKAFVQTIKAQEVGKTSPTKIIEKNIFLIDETIKKFLGILSKIALPLIVPIFLYNSPMGKVAQKKIFGSIKDGNRPNVAFKDIAGLGNAKIQVSELVDFLKNPSKYKAIGAKVPKGALLSGPPGTGKTMLAKACAGEAQVPFFSVSGSQFVELYAGMGATRVRDLFQSAKKQTPAIIFIDEIDAIGRKRQDKFGGANDQRANTLNQLLVQMDGFGTADDIIVLAATNRKEMLDNALTRPGRFDRIVEIELPDIIGRKKILEIYLGKIKLSPSQTLQQFSKRISTLTFGFSGADLANLCNEAAIIAVRKQKQCVELSDFEEASDRVLAGIEQSFALNQYEKKKVAYHECGHAVVSWFLEGASPLLKITIVPRSKGSLGFAKYLPNQSMLMTKQMLCDQLCVALGGRMSEQIFFGEVSSGAGDDLQKVRRIARSIVISYGMNTKYPNYAPIQTHGQNLYSQKTAEQIDDQVFKLIEECTAKTRILLEQHRQQNEQLAEAVIKKESLNHKEIKDILGERPFPIKENYRSFLDTATSELKYSWLK